VAGEQFAIKRKWQREPRQRQRCLIAHAMTIKLGQLHSHNMQLITELTVSTAGTWGCSISNACGRKSDMLSLLVEKAEKKAKGL